MQRYILLFIILFIIKINNIFSASINTITTSYNTSTHIKECNNQARNNTSGLKYIVDTENNSAPSSGNMNCESHVFFSGVLSNYINKNTSKSCKDIIGENYSYASYIRCYDSSNNLKTCTEDGSGWTKYKLFCKYEFKNENVILDTNNFNNNWIANGNPQNIEISFPFSSHNLKNNIDTLKFKFNIKDNTSINWYTKEKNAVFNSAVEINNSDSDTFSGENRNITYNNVKDNLTNGDKIEFPYKFYNSTNIAGTNNNGFIYTTIGYDIKFTDGGEVNNILYTYDQASNLINNIEIALKIKNLYDISFSGEQIDRGLIEGITQTGSINITKNGIANETNRQLLLTQSGSSKNDFIGTGTIDYAKQFKIPNLPNDLDNSYVFYNPIGNNETKDFKTFFSINQNSSDIGDIKNLKIFGYIRYNINGKTITYLGDIIGGDKGQNNAGLKIYGNTNISNKKIRDITSNQNNKNIHNLNGKISKSSLKSKIRSKAYSTIKYLTKNTDTNVNENEAQNIGNKILYYDLRNDSDHIIEIKINKLNTNKTIVVYGGNLYITCDGTNCSTDGNHFPGIIIMKDNNGIGGKLYIDPKISRIDGAIYMDKSVISYNNIFGEISPNNGGTYDVLKKQLYIKGSLFSENTIGGSRLSPPVCPFYLYSNPGFSCNLDTAQKYDLNYLRRGIENKQAGKGDYPVIIEYNPKIKFNPPYLFSN